MKYRKALTFSYDDGIEQDRKLVEIFNRYGMKATFNLNTGIQSPESNFEIEGVHINRMKQDGLAELYKGHEIATHGLTHATIKLKATCHHDDEMLFELAEKFIKAEPKEDEPMLFYVWGHSYEFDVNNNWDRIEKFCKMMAGRDDIFYGTNRECLVD